ncbi:MAG: hypothetical protein EOP11_13155, partial [Proteobacteria bacterium]
MIHWANKQTKHVRGSFLLLALLCAHASPALAQKLTLQGRVTNASGQPINGSATKFRVQILSPDSANHCILYDETHIVDLSLSYGLFSLNLGEVNPGRVSRDAPTNFSLEQALSNRSPLSVPGTFCSPLVSGTASYVPNADDNRKVIIQFLDPVSMGSQWESIPEMEINPVAYAIDSRSLGGYPANSVLRVTDMAGAPAAFPALTSAEATELSSLVGGTSQKYLPQNSTNGVRVPTGAPGSPLAGSIWFEGGNLRYSDGTTTQTLGTASAGTITNITAGTGLTGGGSTGSVSLALSSSGVTNGSYGSATSVPVITVDIYGRITLASSATIAGVAPGGAASGDLSGSYPSPTVSKLRGIALSASAPVAGQIYKFDDKGTPSASDDEYVPSNIFASDLKSRTLSALLPTTCAGNEQWVWSSVTDSYSCAALSGITGAQLADAGPGVGTYRSVTIDAKGRVSAGTNPTTIAGYGLTDAVQNGGLVPKISSGSDSPMPTGSQEGELFVATNSKKIYRYASSTWTEIASAAGSGSVTDVLVGSGLTRSVSGSTITLNLPAISAVTNAVKVSTDAYGRVTGAGSLSDTDIPSLPFSKITPATLPATLAAHGITDAVTALGDAKRIRVGAASTKGAASASGTIFIASDTGAMSYDTGSAWVELSSGALTTLAGEVGGPPSATVVNTVG